MNSIISIKQATLKGNLFIEVVYDEKLPNNITNTIKRNSTAPVHNDLTKAFEELNIHLAIICEEIEAPSDKKFKELKAELKKYRETEDKNLFGEKVLEKVATFSANHFKISGNGENAGCVIGGNKQLTNFKNVGLVTPHTRYEDDYKFGSELAEAIGLIDFEIQQFILHGKQAPEAQRSLEFEVTGLEEETQEA